MREAGQALCVAAQTGLDPGRRCLRVTRPPGTPRAERGAGILTSVYGPCQPRPLCWAVKDLGPEGLGRPDASGKTLPGVALGIAYPLLLKSRAPRLPLC